MQVGFSKGLSTGARLASLLMTLVVAGERLEIRWTPHPDNLKLTVVYHCNKDSAHPAFYAVNVWDIPSTESYTAVHRIMTPVGQQCLIGAQVMRGYAGWDGDQDKLIRAEWQLLVHTEGKGDS